MNTWFISMFMITFQVLYVFSLIGIFATAMQCCWKKVSATQFTLYMTISNMGRITGAKLIGPIKAQFDWQYSIFACVVMMTIAWGLMQLIYLSRQAERLHELEAIEKQEVVHVQVKIERIL
jgi:PAT family beta-lactamase induction signal transducer AmpG